MPTKPESARKRGSRRLERTWLIVIAGALALGVSGVGVTASSAKKPAHHRVGGKVKRAWPRAGKPPQGELARWLARQVGPKACGKKGKLKKGDKKARRLRKACHAKKRARGSVATSAGASPGDPISPSLRSSEPVIAAGDSGGLDVAWLVRSYQIPKDDPSYQRLVDWSWTYDSSVSAAAFVATDEKDEAVQLLDQLAALQYKDGSIDIAFNVATGEGAKTFRAGSVAWLGLAASSFDLHFKSDRYLDTSRRAADYLLGLQEANGLIRGGPKLEWFSTQHNLLAYTFLVRLSAEFKGLDDEASDRYLEAAKRISAAIDSELLVDDGSGPHFIEGLDDPLQPLDVQAIGAMYLAGRSDAATADQVLDGARAHFHLGNRSIRLSNKIATYNMTWEAKGPFNGYRPYYAKGSPEVIWFEGNAALRQATAATGGDTSELDEQAKLWRAVTEKSGGAPLQSDRTVTSDSYGVEYHVWPAAAGAAWWILAESDPSFFAG